MRIVSRDFDDLVETFGAPRRLASRLGALSRRGLLLSEALLELALEQDALGALLLSREFLDAAAGLSLAGLAALAESHGAASSIERNPLAIAAHGDARVLCLAEEAEEAEAPGEPNGARSDDAATALAVSAATGPSLLIAPKDAAKLLGPDEIGRLRLELATSADEAKRLEALRKLWLANLPREELLHICLAALRDQAPDLRAEAAKALAGLGMDLALAENIGRAVRGAVPERLVAISNLGRLAERLDDPQRRLGLGVLTELLRPSEEREVTLGCLGATTAILSRLQGAQAEPVAPLGALHKRLVELLQVYPEPFETAAAKLYEAMYGVDRDETSRLLAALAEETPQRRQRFFALGLICRHDLDAAAEPAILQRLVEGLCTGSELDTGFQACAAALVKLGRRALGALMESSRAADETGRARIGDLLGQLLQNDVLNGEDAARAADACVDIYLSSGAGVRTVLLEGPFYRHPALSEARREAAIGAFIDDLHAFRFERQRELLQNALRRCGRSAIAPLAEAMRESAYDETRLTAAALLPDIVETDQGLTAEDLAELIRTLRSLLEDEHTDFPARGPLYIAMARIAGRRQVSEALATEVGGWFREELGRSSSAYDVLEALGYLAAGENLNSSERLEIGHLLLRVLKKDLPGISGRMRRNAEGEQVLHFGRETTAYTDMIPRLLEGLGRLIRADKTPRMLRERIEKELIDLWREVTDYRRIWAPASVIALARLLGEIARGAAGAEGSPESVEEIAALLTRKIVLMPVMQVVSSLARMNPDSERMDAIALDAFHELSRRLTGDAEPDVTERRQILETMAAIAGRRGAAHAKEIEHARRVTVEALFDAMKDRIWQARSMLEDFIASPEVSEKLRADVRRRLEPASRRD